jgi:hypothetical protein
MASFIRVTDWERVSLWRRLLGASIRVAAFLVIVAVVVKLLGPPITIFFTARWEAKKAPQVSVTPRPLADYSVSDAAGTEVSYFGYEFEVPWKTSFKKKAFSTNGIVQLEFESGQNVTFILATNQGGLLTEIVADPTLHMNNLQSVFGDLMNRSAYDQYSALLNATPQSIQAFGPRAEAIRGMALLTIKAIAIGPGLETGAFSFELPDKRGFQVGDPRKSRRIDLEIYGMGNHHVEIICAIRKDGIWLSQPEINRVLTSLRPAMGGSREGQPVEIKERRN